MFSCNIPKLNIVMCLQVITPLPSHIPQCKALYDFKMTNDEERDCLTFNKVSKILRVVMCIFLESSIYFIAKGGDRG